MFLQEFQEIIWTWSPALVTKIGCKLPIYCTVSVRKATGCTEPLAAITETVDVVERGEIGSTPQPVQRPNPSPAAIATDSRLKPRRFFQPKQHNTTASAELG